jgi:hypothetical protein
MEETTKHPMREQFTQLGQMFRFARPYRVRLIVGTVAVVIAFALLGLERGHRVIPSEFDDELESRSYPSPSG